MAEVTLTQAEADLLIQLEKHAVDQLAYDYPGLGGHLRVPLTTSDKRENFVLDITKSYVNLSKGTYQNRARNIIPIARLDFGGAPHRNPDDEDIPCPHLHVYKEGYGDKWAIPLPQENFRNTTDIWVLLQEFMAYINVKTLPNINQSLFQ